MPVRTAPDAQQPGQHLRILCATLRDTSLRHCGLPDPPPLWAVRNGRQSHALLKRVLGHVQEKSLAQGERYKNGPLGWGFCRVQGWGFVTNWVLQTDACWRAPRFLHRPSNKIQVKAKRCPDQHSAHRRKETIDLNTPPCAHPVCWPKSWL